jgi:hypothetical protein
MPPPASGGVVSSLQRAQRARDFKQLRLAKSARLDRFLVLVRDKCPVEFVTSGQLLPHNAFAGCSYPEGLRVPMNNYLPFKRSFRNFEKFAYCWNCGSPQDRSGNQESPDCHRAFKYGRGMVCPWADFTFVAVFCMWHLPHLQAALLEAFALSSEMTYDDFVEWLALEEKEAGEYFKLLEVFLWYCERWHASP